MCVYIWWWPASVLQGGISHFDIKFSTKKNQSSLWSLWDSMCVCVCVPLLSSLDTDWYPKKYPSKDMVSQQESAGFTIYRSRWHMVMRRNRATVLLQALCSWFWLVARPEKALLGAQHEHWTPLLRLAMTRKVEPYSPNSTDGTMQDRVICSNINVVPYQETMHVYIYICIYNI